VHVQLLPIEAISPGRNLRRKLGGIDELAGSLAAHGLLQPVIVRGVGKHYELVAGHRRFEAAKQLGWTTIPAIVRSETEPEAYVLTLVENLQRVDLSPREEASGLETLIREQGWSTRQVAAAILRSQAYVSKRLRVFDDPILAPAVLAEQLSVSAAEELLSVDERHRYDLLARAVANRWGRAEVRRAVQQLEAQPARRRLQSLVRRSRELRVDLRDVHPEDLTEADRRELRLLFQELAMLARARPGAARVFPALPSVRKR
jgi:ParB family chromosome partitioning protein